ncbi:hypothetical protein [Kitasatospora sp. DSM 101779]|uniref:hypothetical protein n=1 Tax=Kitasatospora sp. DSM 101779 TaxID=2853165 RepID=UPI00398672E5
MAAIEEAATLYRNLATTRPDTYLPNLAGSLHNRTLRLGDVGRLEDALAAIEEAATLYRNLATTRPDTYLPNLERAQELRIFLQELAEARGTLRVRPVANRAAGPAM